MHGAFSAIAERFKWDFKYSMTAFMRMRSNRFVSVCFCVSFVHSISKYE